MKSKVNLTELYCFYFSILKNQGQQESRNKAMLRDEFFVNMQKFTSSITRTIQQIEGGVRLQVPDLAISPHMSGRVFFLSGCIKESSS